MQSVTSNAVASALEWEDITDSVSFTKVTTSGNFTNYTIEDVKCFIRKNEVNLSFMYKFGQSLGSGYTTLRTKIISTKFTTREKISLASGSIFYGNMVGAIRLGGDGDDSNTLITRIPANSQIVANATVMIIIRFPI